MERAIVKCMLQNSSGSLRGGDQLNSDPFTDFSSFSSRGATLLVPEDPSLSLITLPHRSPRRGRRKRETRTDTSGGLPARPSVWGGGDGGAPRDFALPSGGPNRMCEWLGAEAVFIQQL